MNPKTIRNLNIVKGILSAMLIAFVVSNFHDFAPSASAAPFLGGQQMQIGGQQQMQTGQQQIQTGQQGQIGGQQIQVIVRQDLHGFAWSDMPDGSDQNITPSNQQGGRGLGWISMNGTDVGTDLNGYYKVSMNGTTGSLSGMGWSEMGGWVDFAPSGPYPTSGSSSAKVDPTCLAAATSTSCPVTGWIRFVAGEDTNTQNTGGWDGWVNMSGHSNIGSGWSFGVTYDAKTGDTNYGKFSGDAWGSEVAGWINFDRVSITPTVVNGCMDPTSSAYGISLPCTCLDRTSGTPVSYTYTGINMTYPSLCSGHGGSTASVTLTSSGCSNGNTTLSWPGAVGIATCTASTSGSPNIIGFSGTVSPNGGPTNVSGIPQDGSPYNFTIMCTTQSGYTPPTVTSTTSVTCPSTNLCADPHAPNFNLPGPCLPCVGSNCGGTGTQTPVVPVPVYKEN